MPFCTRETFANSSSHSFIRTCYHATRLFRGGQTLRTHLLKARWRPFFAGTTSSPQRRYSGATSLPIDSYEYVSLERPKGRPPFSGPYRHEQSPLISPRAHSVALAFRRRVLRRSTRLACPHDDTIHSAPPRQHRLHPLAGHPRLPVSEPEPGLSPSEQDLRRVSLSILPQDMPGIWARALPQGLGLGQRRVCGCCFPFGELELGIAVHRDVSALGEILIAHKRSISSPSQRLVRAFKRNVRYCLLKVGECDVPEVNTTDTPRPVVLVDCEGKRKMSGLLI